MLRDARRCLTEFSFMQAQTCIPFPPTGRAGDPSRLLVATSVAWPVGPPSSGNQHVRRVLQTSDLSDFSG